MFQLNAEGRLKAWREFRTEVNSLPLENALARTAELWSTAPYVPYYLDYGDVEKWPGPWDLIHENYYCDIAKCLGIVYTMQLTEHKKDLTTEIRTYIDPETQYVYNLSWFNQGKYILNLIDSELVNIEQFNKLLTLKHQFTAVDLKLEKY
jgi:hypothetical protein